MFKALACGAEMVFIGRPVLHGLAVGVSHPARYCSVCYQILHVQGEEGVRHVIELLRREFDYALKLSGCTTVGQIRCNPGMVVHKSHYVSKF
jgi:(S)-2-hydroxy-acid oxidase